MFELTQRQLTIADIPAAVKLSAEPGWNQTGDDWRMMIEIGDSFGRFTGSGALVASGLTVPYGSRFGWISMILVTKTFRRRGIATEIMRQCMDALIARKLVPALDATPEGRQVYLPLGFKDIYPITRFFADAPRRVHAAAPPGVTLRWMDSADLGTVIAYDAERCGADRGHILRRLHKRLLGCALVAEADGLVGYALGRDGRTCAQIGPILADDQQVATALIATALTAVSGPVCIDLLDAHKDLVDYAQGAGFRPQFPFIRMSHGRSTPFDDPARIFAIAGPELG